MKISDWLRRNLNGEQLTEFEISELETRLVRLFAKMVKATENQENSSNTGLRPNQTDI